MKNAKRSKNHYITQEKKHFHTNFFIMLRANKIEKGEDKKK